MGSEDEESRDDMTPQQSYYAELFHLEQFGTPEQVAQFSAGGPPPPRKADGVTGKILFYEANMPTLEEFAGLLAEMETSGWITSEVREKVEGLPRAQGVAELKVRMVEPDCGQPSPAAGTE
ncbi:hypothetical protein NONI108955_28020 [Nocardia ninae]|uniref:Uncharacterized protein n=1 Tax=Nocardia ninae NBRC 108245 TaxID=1210091 RepID=A0A511MHF0_9NOCA|nr:hypothetical protein [Nocardia ninae]GEM40082.1 hypothetical protein NN4_46010 [Nocardia ninae NBRC 108245]